MGAIYQTTDSRLGREVALKILPEKCARDPQRIGRFQREATVLASLNYPSISIHLWLEGLLLGISRRQSSVDGLIRDRGKSPGHCFGT